MSIKHFPGSYLGNKKDDYKHFEHLLPNDAKTIVEPFCGTFAVCRMHYYDTQKYKVHINDISSEIIELLNLVKNDYEKFKLFMNCSKMYIKQIVEKNRGYGSRKDVDIFLKHIVDISEPLQTYFFKSFVCRGIVKHVANCGYDDLNKFLQEVTITQKNYSEILEQYKNDETAFLFVDPPYFNSDNTQYTAFTENLDCDKNILDNTKMYVDLSKFIKICKCKIMIIVNENYLMHYIFDGYIKGTYRKQYSVSKKNTTHLIICNY